MVTDLGFHDVSGVMRSGVPHDVTPFSCHVTWFSVEDPFSFGFTNERSRVLEGQTPTPFTEVGVVVVFETTRSKRLLLTVGNGDRLVGDTNSRVYLLYWGGGGDVWTRMTVVSDPTHPASRWTDSTTHC